MTPNEAITRILPPYSGAKLQGPFTFMSETQLWLFQWKNMLKVSFCSIKKKKIPPKAGQKALYLFGYPKYRSKLRSTFFIVFAVS